MSSSYRRNSRRNAERARISPADWRASVGALGKMSLELPWLWRRAPNKPLGDLVQWEGPPLIEQAVQAGQPLLLLTPHLGTFEVAARTYAERYGAAKPITVLYRPARVAWLAKMQEQLRPRPGLLVAQANATGVRQMLRALRAGQTLGLLPDQVPPEGQGVWAPFFGQPAYTMTFTAKVARQTGAQVVLVWAERMPRGRGWVFHQRAVHPELNLHDADDERAATAVNRAMEGLIMECPGQYVWGYHRYRRPHRQASVLEATG